MASIMQRLFLPRAVHAASVAGFVAFVVLGALMTGAAPAAAADSAPRYDDDQAQAFVEDYVGRHGLPGAAYVVVRDGELVTEGAIGDVGVDTAMSVGSLSKSITAFAVLQQVDRGRVDLDAAVTEYLEDFSVQGADPDDITVRRLLSHTSGLPNPLLLRSTGSLAGDVADIADLEVESRPGTAYAYSNLNYRVLARVVEVVSGEAFDPYLRRHVFEPLRMDDTRSVISVSASEGLDAGHVTAYGAAIPLPELAGDVGGAGGVISTAQDMGRWLEMQQAGGVAGDGTRLLSARLVSESHQVQTGAQTYGFGWQHTTTADPARIGHDGSLTRYSSRMDLVPSSGLGVVVLLDSNTPTLQHPFEISTGLIEIDEARMPDVGAPVATLVDLGLGVVTLLAALLGLRGVARSATWVARRRSFPRWRFGLRLLPQLVMPALAVLLFLGLTSGRGNAATPVDAFGLWPAATTLVLVTGLVGLVLTVTRTIRWASGSADSPPTRGAEPPASVAAPLRRGVRP